MAAWIYNIYCTGKNKTVYWKFHFSEILFIYMRLVMLALKLLTTVILPDAQ